MIIARTVRDPEKTESKMVRLRAVCDSPKCTTVLKADNANRGVEKNVSKHQVFCSDCGSALFWTKFESNYPRRNDEPRT